MMLDRIDLGNARMSEYLESAARHNRRQHNRGSPVLRLRQVLARRLVLTGARLHGEEPAVIGRVVILDQCGHAPQSLRTAA